MKVLALCIVLTLDILVYSAPAPKVHLDPKPIVDKGTLRVDRFLRPGGLGLGGRLGGGPAVSSQGSQVHGGDGVTGIANGISTAEGGRGGALSNQNSIATGGHESTLVADGQSHAAQTQLGGLRGGLGGRLGGLFGGGPTISGQSSQVHGGIGTTGIAHGISTAQGGPGGAASNQHSLATGGAGSTLVADGESHASSRPGFGKRSVDNGEREARIWPFSVSKDADSIAGLNQVSQADNQRFSNAQGNAFSQGNRLNGPRFGTGNSAGVNGQAVSGNVQQNPNFPRFPSNFFGRGGKGIDRTVRDTTSDLQIPASPTSNLISSVIQSTVNGALTKARTAPRHKLLISQSSSGAKSPEVP